jgi:glutamine synthetase
MIEARKVCNKIEENAPKAKAYCDQVVPFFDKIRYHADKLEQLVDNQLWPLPKYREILSL